MAGDKTGDAAERAQYAGGQLLREAIVAGVPATAIGILAENGYIGTAAFPIIMGIWRVIRPQVLAMLPGRAAATRAAEYNR